MMVAGYEVAQEILRHDWYTLRRAFRRDGGAVLIKNAAPGEGETLRREFALLQGLETAGAPRVVELLPDGGAVWEDGGARPLPLSLLLDQKIFYHL